MGMRSRSFGLIGAARPICHTGWSPATGRGGSVRSGQLIGVALNFMGRATGFSTPSVGAVDPLIRPASAPSG